MKEELDGLFETLENDLLSRSQYKLLLDYITNLQEENKNRISESLSYDLAKAKIKELEYKIDKAIEYIEKEKYDIETTFRIKSKEFLQENVTSVVPSFKLLEILKGE